MKTIHFYGCSFTAGDELSDSEIPELSNHDTKESYWRARQAFLHDGMGLNYIERNKQKAYPAKVATQGFETSNFANNGASLEEMIYKIIFNLSFHPAPDVIFLQIPPTQREAIFLDSHPYISSIRFTDHMPGIRTNKYNDYIANKIMLFSDSDLAVSDLLKLYSLKYFLEAKNIPLYLLDTTDDLELRYSLVKSVEYHAILNTLKSIPTLRIFPIVRATEDAVTFAGHFTEKIHQIIANMIVEILG
jgi:hypothetical protein